MGMDEDCVRLLMIHRPASRCLICGSTMAMLLFDVQSSQDPLRSNYNVL
jgi:hypothetical protein